MDELLEINFFPTQLSSVGHWGNIIHEVYLHIIQMINPERERDLHQHHCPLEFQMSRKQHGCSVKLEFSQTCPSVFEASRVCNVASYGKKKKTRAYKLPGKLLQVRYPSESKASWVLKEDISDLWGVGFVGSYCTKKTTVCFVALKW